MRSSIACTKCRRSKIKCDNNGTNRTCRACAATGRDCVYPSPAPGQHVAKRPDAPGALKNEGETEAKRARKRETDSARKHQVRHGDDPFESPPITPKLWKDVYNAFMLHCSTELPFLHEEIFHTRIHQPAAERSPDTQIFLLGMLTLTARFVPDLVAFHNQGDPLAASEFYAEAFAARLDAPALTAEPSLERLQGVLMLSLYHWGMCRGQRAWMYLTIAIGMAQVMGLMFEDDPRASQRPQRPSLVEEARQLGIRPKTLDPGAKSDEQALIHQEIKRRTAYSCFILDRYQASGRYRPQIINIDDLHVQLPCSEEDFQFGIKVKTGSLKDSPSPPDSNEASRTIASTQVLSIYIRLVEIWGRFSRWSCKGGRREEIFPPWSERSEFYQLRKQLEAFHDSLPPKLTFSPTKIAAHIAAGSITLYTAIHTLYSLCNIVLHREYIPFVPLRCQKPSGPLDEPTFPPETVPAGFWEESAEIMFKSARDIMEIVRVTSDRQVLVESPQVGFAVWTAAFVGICSINFPHMDQACYMCDPPLNDEHSNAFTSSWKGATGLAIKTLNQMKPKSKMACGWSFWIDRMHRYFEGIKRDYDSSIRALGGPSSEHARSLREGGLGGGLEEYKLLEKELKDFGPSLEQVRYDSPESRGSPFSRASTRGPHIKMETAAAAASADARPATRNGGEGSWAAVNNGAAPPDEYAAQSMGYPSHSPQNGMHSTTYYPRAPTSNPPSLLSGTNARSTPVDLSSPYARSEGYVNGGGGGYGRRVGGGQVGGGQEQYKMGPGWDGGGGARNAAARSPENAFRSLDQINMQGVDVAAFGGGLDYAYWPDSLDSAGMGGPGGLNFMQAAAGPVGVWHQECGP